MRCTMTPQLSIGRLESHTHTLRYEMQLDVALDGSMSQLTSVALPAFLHVPVRRRWILDVGVYVLLTNFNYQGRYYTVVGLEQS